MRQSDREKDTETEKEVNRYRENKMIKKKDKEIEIEIKQQGKDREIRKNQLMARFCPRERTRQKERCLEDKGEKERKKLIYSEEGRV